MINISKKKIFKYLVILFPLFIFIGIASVVNAQVQLLTPLTGGGSTVVGNSGDYIKNLYTIGVGLAGILAATMIVVGGIEYITSAASPSGRADANKRIWAAVGGLLIALLSYLILSTINPKLVEFNIAINGGGVSGEQQSQQNISEQKKKEANKPYFGYKTDSEARRLLKKGKIEINNECVGGTNGTCFNNMRAGTLNEVIFLKAVIGNVEKGVIVTGGTEIRDKDGNPVHVRKCESGKKCYTHANGYKIDIRSTTVVNKYIEENFTNLNKKRSDGAFLYINPATGATYAREKNHWDIKVVDPAYLKTKNSTEK